MNYLSKSLFFAKIGQTSFRRVAVGQCAYTSSSVLLRFKNSKYRKSLLFEAVLKCDDTGSVDSYISNEVATIKTKHKIEKKRSHEKSNTNQADDEEFQ